MNTADPFRPQALEVGITEQLIKDVVSAFYKKVRADPVLGPLFVGAIGTNWDPHIKRITSFWLTATRLKREYEGRRFMPAHLRHRSIHAEHVSRWLALFRETASERCTPAQAAALIDIGERMAENIKLGLDKRDRERSQGAAP